MEPYKDNSRLVMWLMIIFSFLSMVLLMDINNIIIYTILDVVRDMLHKILTIINKVY